MRSPKIRTISIFLSAMLLASGTAFADLTSYIDEHNRFILNGEPFFPLGLYVVQCPNGSYSSQLDEIADSPFDTVMNYAINECGSDATDAEILGYLDQLESRDLNLIYYLAAYFDGAPIGTATWTFDVAVDGTYNVYAWWDAGLTRATDAPYTVNYSGGSETIRVNQKIDGSQWNLLGSFSFVAGTSGSIVVSNDADELVIADAVKIEGAGPLGCDIIMDEELATFTSTWNYVTGKPERYNGDHCWHAKFFDDIDAISHKVNTFKTHPAVISWYLNDERDPATYLTQLEERYQQIRELDENHPVWSVHWYWYWLLQEAHTTDIVGMDSYPIDNGPITAVSYVADKAMGAGKLLWFVPQIFNWQDYPSDPRSATGRPPTREEMRAMSYLAINHGARGLIYYSYFNIRDDADYATRWPQIKAIASEIDQLRPVLLSVDQTNEEDVTCDNADIDFKLMRENNRYYLFAVNTKEAAISGVPLQLNMVLESAVVEVLFESGRQVLAPNGSLEDDFNPYEVHVYYWQGSPDEDGDGISDEEDNCPSTPNPVQEDSDTDGIGDACDVCPNDPDNDIDGDGFCGDVDNCPAISNAGQEDSDGDGAGDVCDNCPTAQNADQVDSDSDGLGDVCDACAQDPDNDADGDGLCGNVDFDDDNDGLPDSWELYYGLDPLDATGDNGSDGDLDDDTWTNYQEYVSGTDPSDPEPASPIAAHRSVWYGVYRSGADYPTGSCAHCHDTFNSSTCGLNQLMLFAASNPTGQTDNFCFECHSDPVSSVQSGMTENTDYGGTFGGGTANAANIKDAFAYGKPVGTWEDGSSHRLRYVRNWPNGKAWAPWVTPDTNACVICHDPHHAQKNSGADPHVLGGVMTAIRRIADGGSNTSNQWGDEPLVSSGLAEMMSDHTAKYQAPYRADAGYEPKADSTVQNGSNLPNFVTFCLDCHSMEVPEDKTDAPNRQHPQLNLIAVNWGPSGDQMGETYSPGHGNGDVGGALKDPYTADANGNGDYALCCTDCHEPHGSPNEYLLRTCVNGKDDCTVSVNGQWYSFCTACHVVYTNDSNPRASGMHTLFTTAEAPTHDCRGCHGHKSPVWERYF